MQLLGAIIGDIIGSRFEFNNIKTTEFELFTNRSEITDDTIMTIAVADSIVNNKDFVTVFQYWGRKYPDAGYGGAFRKWIHYINPQPYNSWGNGSAMRVSPVGFAYNTIEEILKQAKMSAEVTHNHPEGIKGAQATAVAIFLARQGNSKDEIKKYIEENFYYNFDRTIAGIRPEYYFNESCQGTVPEAIIAFLESTDFESAIRLAVSLGGDSDTIACITGGIAQAFYKKIPDYIVENTFTRLPDDILEIIVKFNNFIAGDKSI